MAHDQIEQIKAGLQRAGGGSSDYDLNKNVVLDPSRALRPAGVLAPIFERDGRFELLLTKRSSALKHHPGQISFPGGKQEKSDQDIVATALREAHEEIGLHPEQVEVLGVLPSHETVTHFQVTPVIALVRGAFTPIAEPGEVAEVFSVPLDHVLDARNFLIHSRRWRKERRFYYVVPYGPYYIWGATARMLKTWTDLTTS